MSSVTSAATARLRNMEADMAGKLAGRERS
jgi:hypothetical protein